MRQTASGAAIALVVVLVGGLLYHLGLVASEQKFEFSVFMPLEFWNSFTGLAVVWSQQNEWLLLGLGAAALVPTVASYRLWRRSRLRRESRVHPQAKGLRYRVLRFAQSLKAVGAFATLSALLLSAWVYQQFLWHVALPIDDDRIGIAFTRQFGSTVAREQLFDHLRDAGHEGQIVVRDLPVTFDARDIDRARQLAQRIRADAVVIYREEAPVEDDSTIMALDAGGPGALYRAYIVFADPSIGVEVPLPAGSDDRTTSVSYRTKQGLAVPTVQSSELARLLEATAGILLFDQDRYLQAIAHLRAAVPTTAPASADDGLVYFYLGTAHYLLQQDDAAIEAYEQAVTLLEQRPHLTVQDRLALAGIHNARGFINFYARRIDDAEDAFQDALALRDDDINPGEADPDDTSPGEAGADTATLRQAHRAWAEAFVGLLQVSIHRGDDRARRHWGARIRREAETLLAMTGDPRARVDGARVLLAGGSCADAYREALAMGEDPENVDAARLLAATATLRDLQGSTSIEATHRLRHILEAQPGNLRDLQRQAISDSIFVNLEDPESIDALQRSTDAILRVNPRDVAALSEYVDSARLVLGWRFVVMPGIGLADAHYRHLATARLQRREWVTDPTIYREILADADALEPYLFSWSEELAPHSSEPLLAAARVSSEAWQYGQQYTTETRPGSMGESARDAALVEEIDLLFAPAVDDAERVLAEREPTPRHEAEAHKILASLWNYRHLELEIATAPGSDEALATALRNAESARDLVDRHPDPDSTALDWRVYQQLGVVYASARGEALRNGDHDGAEQYDRMRQEAFTRSSELRAREVGELETGTNYLGQRGCPETRTLADGRAAAAAGDHQRAAELLREYVAAFPGDPVGQAELAWAQYRAGDMEAALVTIDEAVRIAPAYAPPFATRTVILLALARETDAYSALGTFLDVAAEEPTAVHLSHLADFAAELEEFAHGNESARPAVARSLQLVESQLQRLPERVTRFYGSVMVELFRALGGAAWSSGDEAAAARFFQSGLDINGTHVLLRVHSALVKVAEGDDAGARSEVAAAIAAADTYSVGLDPEFFPELVAQADAVATDELRRGAQLITEYVARDPARAGAGEELAAQLLAAAEEQ